MIISTGKSRKDYKWRSLDTDWASFVARLREPVRTHETAREYRAMSKEDKSRAKDVGGFVGGRLKDGRRLKDAVLDRCLVTLDLDYAEQDAWDNIAIWGWRCALYSTHSHRPEAPRLRLILPLDRAVTPEEYEPIARRVGESIGFDQLDLSTFELNRLMYWPSCPRDGEYVFREQEGEVLCADEVLASYGPDEAWKDTRLWPIGKKEPEIRRKETKRRGDPRDVPGIVGLFCRAYSIREAIDTFLADKYEEGPDGRYTYTGGSTTGGGVVYAAGDGAEVWMYSNHGTDPAGQQLCNAFDLVRIHLFGERDGDLAAQDTPITKRPSYALMAELASRDREVLRLKAEEAQARAEEQFGDLDGSKNGEKTVTSARHDEIDRGDGANDDAPDPDEVTDDFDPDAAEWDEHWMEKLDTDAKGNYTATISNILAVLLNDPKLRGRIATDRFAMRRCVIGSVPWRRGKEGVSRYWEDADDGGLRMYLESVWRMVSRPNVEDAVQQAAEKQSFHPVRRYLRGLQWDGVERLDTMLIRALGADDTPLNRAISRKWMVAACKRVFRPGCKFDTLLVLVSPRQGIGKSMFGDVLGGEWFKDGLGNLDSKDARQELRGKWIVEVSEMAATKKAEDEQIKQFFACRVDSYRESYGRHSKDFPRQCVFIGTSNIREFIVDETGGRRYWPVEVHADAETAHDRIEALRAERDQLWAEAMVRYREGESVEIRDASLREEVLEAQERSTQQDEWVGMIQAYLDRPRPANWEQLTPEQRHDYIQGYLSDLDTEPKTYRLRETTIADIRYELLDERLIKGAGGNNPSSRHISRLLNASRSWMATGRKTPPSYIWGRQRIYERVGPAAKWESGGEVAGPIK